MKANIDKKVEKKLGAKILETVMEIQNTPHDNVERFLVLRRRLEKAVKRYQEYTGRDKLDPNTDYGFKLQ